MSREDWESAALISLVIGIAVAMFSTPIIIGYRMHHKHDQAMATIGYRQTMVVGHATPVWVPCQPCEPHK